MPDIEVTAAVLGRLVVQAGRTLDGPFGEVVERYGLTRNAWWLLTELYRTRNDELTTIGEHARRSGLAASSATIATEQLTKRRLTRRWRPKDNRRTTFVAITDAGSDLVDSAREDLERSVSGLYDIFGYEDRRILHDLLSRIVLGDHLRSGPAARVTTAIARD
ncbi:MarR family winged helix-turn-helix transcriptional regulator [Actinoplanes solisilvae]|uniref:MarR family winged helix-turn-helix transcriptional regulator n=1 Tax=Actinoplanes solisilvae TaxID=2486853 RepID=UPI000FDC52BF|nr:MarR family winged helix-turn-helix transcriptional regulator [Actinoplanes solisilvae]